MSDHHRPQPSPTHPDCVEQGCDRQLQGRAQCRAACAISNSTHDVPSRTAKVEPLYPGAVGVGGHPAPVARMVAVDDGLGTVIVEFIGERPPAGTVLYAAGVPEAQPQQFPYDRTFQAIAAATRVHAGGVGIGISVKTFIEAWNAHPTSGVLGTFKTEPEA